MRKLITGIALGSLAVHAADPSTYVEKRADPWKDILGSIVPDEESIIKMEKILLEEAKISHIFSPIDWVALASGVYEKKRDLLEMPDLGLNCHEFAQVDKSNYYDFYQFTDCVWTPVNTFPKFEVLRFALDNSDIPIMNDLLFPFFQQIMKPPHVMRISSNGYITVTSDFPAEQPIPNLDSRDPPFNVITGLWTPLATTENSKVRYGYFRIGYKVICTKFEWSNFRAKNGDQEKVKFQLDICSNGYFTSRIKKAKNLAPSQIGLKYGGGDSYRVTALSFNFPGYDFDSNSAIVMRPRKTTYDDIMINGMEPKL